MAPTCPGVPVDPHGGDAVGYAPCSHMLSALTSSYTSAPRTEAAAAQEGASSEFLGKALYLPSRLLKEFYFYELILSIFFAHGFWVLGHGQPFFMPGCWKPLLLFSAGAQPPWFTVGKSL